jgi:hypothetical protein
MLPLELPLNTKDQGDMYLHTTVAIADFVGVEYGRDMRMLVKHSTEKTLTKPTPRTHPPRVLWNPRETQAPGMGLEVRAHQW